MAAAVALRLIGRPAVLVHGRDTPVWLEPKLAALLALLACEGELARADLTRRLWAEHESAKPADALRSRIYVLHKACGQRVVTGRDLLCLSPGVTHDLAPPDGAGEGPATPIPAIPDALAGLDYSSHAPLLAWVERLRARLRSAWRQRGEAHVQALVQQGDFVTAMAQATRMLDQEPQVEAAHLRLADVQLRSGAPNDARATLDACLSLLQARGQAPSAAMQALRSRLTGAAAPAAAASTAPQDPPEALWHPPRMVAREAERRAVQAAWRRACVVAIEGEPGIGKSRLLQSLAPTAGGALVIGAGPADAEQPYALLTRVLRAARARTAASWPEPVRAELARLLPELGPASTLPALDERLRAAVRDAVVLWRAAGVRRLLLDDVQWADEASLAAVLQALEPRPGQVLPQLALAYRAGHAPAAWVDWARGRSPRVWTVALGPLTRDGLCELLTSLSTALGWADLNALAWATALQPRTLGNPLHVLEALADRWTASGGAGLPPRPAPSGADKPVLTVLQLIDERLSRLSVPARHLAAVAAIAREQFSVDLATRLMRRTALDLAQPWAELESAGVLHDGRLGHDLVADRIRASLPGPITRELHAQVARVAIDKGAADVAVAWHWLQAEAFGHAAAAYERAARKARELNRRTEELALWDRATECLDQLGDGDAAFEARWQAVRAAHAIEAGAAVRERADGLVKLARAKGQELVAWTAVAWVASDPPDLERWGDASQRTEAAVRELRARGIEPPLEQSFGSAFTRATWLAESGSPHEGLKLIDAERPRVEAAGDLRLLQELHEARGWILHRCNRQVQARDAIEQSLRIAEELDDWVSMMESANNLGGLVGQTGQAERALQLFTHALAMADRLGTVDAGTRCTYVASQAIWLGRLGRFAEAFTAYEQALAGLQAAASLTWAARVASNAARLYLDLDRPDLARAMLRRASACTPDMRFRHELLELQITRHEGGDTRAALATLQADVARQQPGHRMLHALEWHALLPAAQAVAHGEELMAELAGSGFDAAEQQLRLQQAWALARAGRPGAAAALAWQAVRTLERHHAFDLHPAQAWCLAHQVGVSVDDPALASQALTAGLAWVRQAAASLPSDWRETFLRHPHGAGPLLAAAAQRRMGPESGG